MESSKLPSFRSFCSSEFKLNYRAEMVQDGRENVEIPASVVYNAATFMGALGLPSLLMCDQMLRTPVGQVWFSSAEPAVSDSTMARSLETMDLASLRPILYDAYRLGRNDGLSKCPLRAGNLRIGIVDGSTFGRFEASCFEVVGKTSLMVDLERTPKRGKELPSTYSLLRRLKDEFGVSFVDIILGDGIYLNAPFFNLCLDELKTDVLVKTDDTSRVIIQDAISFLNNDSPLFQKDIITLEGTDAERMCSYSIKMADGFMMKGVSTSLRVAWVQEVYLRTGELTEFWVVASEKYLKVQPTAQEMRELAHWRWDVENNGFKELNATVHTKHIYSHDEVASEAIMLILFVVFNLIGIYLLEYMDKLTDYPGMKQTRKFAILLTRCIMIAFAFIKYG